MGRIFHNPHHRYGYANLCDGRRDENLTLLTLSFGRAVVLDPDLDLVAAAVFCVAGAPVALGPRHFASRPIDLEL